MKRIKNNKYLKIGAIVLGVIIFAELFWYLIKLLSGYFGVILLYTITNNAALIGITVAITAIVFLLIVAVIIFLFNLFYDTYEKCYGKKDKD